MYSTCDCTWVNIESITASSLQLFHNLVEKPYTSFREALKSWATAQVTRHEAKSFNV